MHKTAAFAREPLSLAEFEARREPVGLFESYCRARVRLWPLRLVMPLILGVVVLFAWNDPLPMLSIAGIVLFDGLDVLLLRRFIRRRPAPDRLPMAQGAAAFTGALHGISVAIATGLLLSLGPEMRFLAVVICIGMVLDSALLFSLNATASLSRTLSHALLLMGIHLVAWSDSEGAARIGLLGDTMAAALLLVFGLSFITTVHSQRKRSQSMQRATLQQADALADMNRTLSDTRQRTRRLAHVVEQTQDFVAVLDSSGGVTWSNAPFSDLVATTARGPGDAVKDLASLLSVGPADRHRIGEAISNRCALRADVLRSGGNAEDIWLDLSVSPMRREEATSDAFVVVTRDISDHKRREEALAEARAAAEAAAEAKSTFLATMSHEIRTPMNGVIATCDLLRETVLDPEQDTLVETISSSGEALLTIINDILDFSKLDAGKLETAQQPFPVAALLRNTVDLVTPLAEAKGLSMTLDCPDSLPGVLIGDEARLRQVLLNLLGNAIKFTERGSVRVHVSATARDGLCDLAISVCDTGIGIAAGRQADIFNTFTQADATISRRFGGTGLGLAISRSLVRAMGGDIRLESEAGRGSRFTISLRLAMASDSAAAASPATGAQTPAAQTAGPNAGAFLSDRRVLVAEDNRTNRMLLEKLLKSTGAAVSFAEDGAQALRLYRQERPDLVLMDMSMPVMDGLEATREIRALETAQGWDRSAILALTANAFEDDRRRCLEAGMDGHLAKPLRKAILLDRLSDHFDGPVPDRPRALAPPHAADAPAARPEIAPAAATGTDS